jgi:hypothetical protein
VSSADRTTGDVRSPVPSPITARAIALGLILVFVLVVTNPYLAFIVDYWTAGSGAVMNGPIAALFLLVLLNGALKRYLPARAFTRSELLVAYAMAIVCVGLAQAGGLPYIAVTTIYPFYMATPENGWETLVLPHIPVWLQLTDLHYAGWFWEGAPAGAGVPWGAWMRPMVEWGGFTVVLMAALFCLGALVRKNWIERQRLTFPIVDLPLAIVGDDAKPSAGSGLFTNRLFWLGFTIPAVHLITCWLNLIYPSFPALQLHDIGLGRVFAGRGLPWSAWSDVYVSIIFPVIGISYLVPTQVSLSLWLFYVLFQLHMLVWASFGVSPWGGGTGVVEPYVFASFMQIGGALALCGTIVYRSRGALLAAWRSVWSRSSEPVDAYAPLSGRWALVGFVLTNAFMLWWVLRAGMSWWSFTLLMGIFYAASLSTAYLVTSGGVMFPDYGLGYSDVLLRTLGARAFKPASLYMMLSLDSIYMLEGFATPLPQMLHSSKLLHSAKIRARSFAWAAGLGVVITVVFGLIAILMTLHGPGVGLLDEWPWTWPGWSIFEPMAANLRVPQMPEGWLQAALGIGGSFVLLLVWVQSRFVWWPISPYGFLLASSYMTNHMMWTSIFLGWACAAIVLRYGGLRRFRDLRPFFLGLVLGYYITKLPITVLSAIFGVSQRTGSFAY